MGPIRIGIIGLSPGSWAANAHLPYLQSPDSKFRVVAVCNSSVESAAKSVKELKLLGDVRTYGNVQSIADDKDIDLVVCATRVDRHYKSILPSLKAGKNVFVEWPLGGSLKEAKELLRVAKENNVKLTAVGLQGRFDAIVETLKDVLAEGRIGKVLSTTVTSQGMIAGQTELENQTYLVDRGSGGSLLSIPALHLLDTVQEVLGELSSFKSLLSNQRPVVRIVKADGSVAKENAKKTTPDHVMIQGSLKSGAVLSAMIRGGAPFKGSPGLEWSIYGEKGEIRITGPNAFIEIVGTNSIQLHDFATDEIVEIALKKGAFAEMGPLNRNVACVYEAIAAGDKTIFCDFERAVKRHQFIEEVYCQNPGV
ncbi:Putative NAD-binding Rossmann fold oxidoreductase family protein [Penicillium brasilianum]|uniref:Putative NAD-binding Rossmann fold oxidoreductase family protein n=1 Tax=Penicillium brasilianum TaxID=104259 RepID=A0A0F7U4W0_PENBI|nr:Putative NAD-binding Rossmann fold oxidoreductase family protein [Penicillium brasilianum]